VLDPGHGRVKDGYFWAVARDDRPWGGKDPPAVAYAYAPGRGAIHGLKLLDNYTGLVQCDGYAAYKTIAAKALDGRITLAFCWSHLRRRFFDRAEGAAPIAREALERIAELYAIEKTNPGHERRRASSHAPGEKQTARHGVQLLARASTGPRLRRVRNLPTSSAMV
jgi:transposase